MLNDMRINTVDAADMTQGTSSEILVRADGVSATAVQLTEDVGFHRQRARLLHDDAGDLHHQSYAIEWEQRTTAEAKKSVVTLLEQLSDLGFSWRDIARMVGVSVPALRKWRTGGGTTGKNRQDLAGLSAACNMIAEHYAIEDVASWFEVPLAHGTSITPIDLYEAGNPIAVFNIASGHVTPESVLDEFNPDWRDERNTSFEVFAADDGHRAIRQRS